jgi:PAS domain S-box-containing protein
MLIYLIHNIALLIALSTFYGLFLQKLQGKPRAFRITIGIWFGLAAIAGMLTPYNYDEGVFFDGRSVILALSGLFGGWIPALISATIAGIYRIMAGGAGVYAGLGTIILCSATGLLFRYYYKNEAFKLTLIQLLYIGFVVNLAMLVSQLLFPWPVGIAIIGQIWLPVLLIFPATFMIIGALLGREQRKIISDEKLNLSERRYRTTLYSIGDAVITTDKKGKITLMNPVAEQLSGWTEAEALGKPLENIFHIINEQSRRKVESPVTKVLESGTIIGLANHTLLVAKNGDEIPIADSGAPIEDVQGNIVGVILVFRDQTEEHLQKSLLEASEIKYRELVESTEAISWEYDLLNDTFIYTAPQVEDKTGWHPSEWTNFEFWKQNIHPEERENTSNFWMVCAQKGQNHSLEYRFRKKNGDYLWVRDLITVETSDNQAVKLRGIMLDITTLKQTELDLKEQQLFLHETQRIGHIGTYLFDIQKNNWTSSPIMDEILGIDENFQKTVQSWNRIVHPDQQSEMMHYFIKTVLGNRQPFNKEYKIIRVNDGKERWVHGHGQLTYDDSGVALRMIGTIQDVTEQKEVENELLTSRSNLISLINSRNESIWSLDGDYRLIVCNNYFRDSYNAAYGILLEMGVDLVSILPPNLKTYWKIKYDAALQGNKVNFEFTESINGKKHYFSVWLNPIYIKRRITGVTALSADVSELVEARENLKLSEEKFRRLFERHSAVHFLLDPVTGRIDNVNQAAADFYGWSIEELKQMSIHDINTMERNELEETLESASQTKNNHFEVKHRLANGEIRDVEIYSSSVNIMGKEYLHSIIHDITEKQQLLRDVLAAKEKAEENDRLKSAFLANMSHEIRTPLNGILGFTGLITGEELPPKNKRMEYSAIINRSAESLMQLINDILEISKLDAGQFSIETREFNLCDTLNSLHTLYRKKLKDLNKEHIQLKLFLSEERLFMTGDETRLTQVFTNLLDNALKFTPAGKISWGIKESTPQSITFFVADTGIGIDPSKQEQIFERFSQADETISRSYGGTGLGLSIVKKMVQLMGGDITVTSDKDKGASFEFYLPNTTKEVLDQIAPIKEENVTVNEKIKILLVEDDPISRMYYEAILNNDLINLITATTGNMAISLAQEENPDVILLDIRLPDMSGLEVTRHLRNSGNKVKIIAQSAYAMPGDKQIAIEAGCNDYLTKPVKANLLLEKIKAISGPTKQKSR